MAYHKTKGQSTLFKQWDSSLAPSFLSENLESIQDQHAFELWSLDFDEAGGRSGSVNSTAVNVTTEREPSDSDETISRSSEPSRVQSRQAGIQQSRQVTPEPHGPQEPQERPAATNSDECKDGPSSESETSKAPSQQESLQLAEQEAWAMIGRFTPDVNNTYSDRPNRSVSATFVGSGSRKEDESFGPEHGSSATDLAFNNHKTFSYYETERRSFPDRQGVKDS